MARMDESVILKKERMICDDLFGLGMLYTMGIDLKKYMDHLQIRNIIIYGLGRVGILFIRILRMHGINVLCGIDMNTNIVCEGVITTSKIKDIPAVADAIIITPSYYADEIIEDLSKYTSIRLITLKELIDNLILIPQSADSLLVKND